MIYDTLANSARYDSIDPRIGKLLRYLRSHDFSEFSDGTVRLDGDRIYFTISNYETKDPSETLFEAHEKYIDVQYMLDGAESFAVTFGREGVAPSESHPERDLYFYNGLEPEAPLELKTGEFLLVFPGELHAPGVDPAEGKRHNRKFVGKILFD